MRVFTRKEGGFHWEESNSLETWIIHNKYIEQKIKGYISINIFCFGFKNCRTYKYFFMMFEYFVFSAVYIQNIFSGVHPSIPAAAAILYSRELTFDLARYDGRPRGLPIFVIIFPRY